MQFPKVFNLATSTLRRYGNNSKACKNFGQSDFVAELVCTELEPVCYTVCPKKVPDQLLVGGIGDL